MNFDFIDYNKFYNWYYVYFYWYFFLFNLFNNLILILFFNICIRDKVYVVKSFFICKFVWYYFMNKERKFL